MIQHLNLYIYIYTLGELNGDKYHDGSTLLCWVNYSRDIIYTE